MPPVCDRPLRRPGAAGLAGAGLTVLVLLLACAAPSPADARASAHQGAAKSTAKGAAARKAARLEKKLKREESARKAASTGPSWTSGERDDHACSKARRKLWQPGEGWVVKRVSLCP